MSARLSRLTALAAAVVVAVACAPATGSPAPASNQPIPSQPAPGASSPGASDAPSTPAAAAVLLKVTSEGGFINPAATLNVLPIVEVLGDGRIVTPGPVDAIAPGPLLAPVQVRETGIEGAAAIAAAIRQAGLDRPATGGPGVPGDSGTDIFAVTIDGQTIETRIAGGGGGPGIGGPGGPGIGGPGGPGLGGSPDPGRAAAFDLLDRLLDPSVAWGSTAGSATPYLPSGYRVYAIPTAPSGANGPVQPVVAWPLAMPLDAFGTAAVPDRGIAGLRQGVVLGPDAATLGPILAAANQETGFLSNGRTWTLAVRALLPDELG